MTGELIKEEPPFITRKQREAIKNQTGCIVWLTGLPSAGKSSIARELDKQLNQLKYHTAVLDGDNLRQGLSKDLGFSESERSENIRRAGEVAKIMVDNGLIVIAAFITPFNSDRDRLRTICRQDFIEVFCDCPLNICQKRDVKGHYQMALEGKIDEFTGVSSPFETPENSAITLHTDEISLDICVKIILEHLAKKNIINLDKVVTGAINST